jgi:hypothetical protein
VALLLVGAEHHEGRAEHVDAEAVVLPAGGHRGLGELLVEHDPLDDREPAAAVLHRPRRRHEAVLAEQLAPLGSPRVPLLRREPAHPLPVGGQVLGQEGLDLLPVGLGFGGVGRVHARPSVGGPGPHAGSRSARHGGRPGL